MADSKRSVVVTSALVIGVVVLLYSSCSRVYESPAIMHNDGAPAEILNCEPPPPGDEYNCAALYCEKTLFDQKIVRPYTHIAMPKHYYKFSDDLSRSVHFATWTNEDKTVIAKCEMKGNSVTAIEFLDRMPE